MYALGIISGSVGLLLSHADSHLALNVAAIALLLGAVAVALLERAPYERQQKTN
jgi:hypothetical protein